MIGLMITLVVFLGISNYLNKKDLIAPSFIFCAVFCFSCMWALLYKEKWDLNLHLNTFLVISVGILTFILTAYFVKRIMFKRFRQKIIASKQEPQYIKIENWKKILFILIEIITIFLTIYFIVQITSGSWSEIGDAIWNYKLRYVTETDFSIPGAVAYMRTAVDVAGYYFSYVLINNWFVTKKVDFLSAIILILSIISGVSNGSRGWAVNQIIACVACVILIYNKTKGYYKNVQFRTILKIMMIGCLVLVVYQAVGTLLGQNLTNFSFMDYLAMYCGAEIKNLDIFLQSNRPSSNIIGSQTLVYIIKWVGPFVGINTDYQLDLPFNSVNGYELGNVYTTFYPFIYDFGIFGLIFFVILMAGIIQFIYEYAKSARFKAKPNFSIILYNYLCSTIVFSFFSNKFYETVFTPNFLVYIILWNLYNLFFCTIRTKVYITFRRRRKN